MSNYSDTAGGDATAYRNYIYQFNTDTKSWTQIGQLQSPHGNHGASVVNVEDVIDYCH